MFFYLKYVVTSFIMSRLWSVCDVQGQCGRSISCQGLCQTQGCEDLGALVDYFDFFLLTILCIYIFIIFSPSVGVFLKKKIFFTKKIYWAAFSLFYRIHDALYDATIGSDTYLECL